MNEEEYEVVPTTPIIPGGTIHNDIGFCYDMNHECHENPESIAELQQYHQDGLVSDEDRDRIYQGKTV